MDWRALAGDTILAAILIFMSFVEVRAGASHDLCEPRMACDRCLVGRTTCCRTSACCCGTAGCNSHLFTNLLHPSDHCFDDFISPMSNFIFFEDPRTLTEARTIFFHHQLPDRVGNDEPAWRRSPANCIAASAGA